MTLSETGACGPRSPHCWRAILHVVEEWSSNVRNASLEAHFEDESLTFVLREPGKESRRATFDISWIAYSDQADRLASLARKALEKIETDGSEEVAFEDKSVDTARPIN